MSGAIIDTPWQSYCCVTCGLIYDESAGWPEEGIAPGTRWEDLPSDWCCPDCSASRDDFQPVAPS